MSACLLVEPGQVPYEVAWHWQRRLVEARIADRSRPDVLVLLEHPPVYTLGQGSDPAFVRFAAGEHALFRTERGGEVTYHGPGQLVGYPILDLTCHRRDLHWYLRQLEEVLIRTLLELAIPATRRPGLTGVWADGRKLAAIGIKVSRWVTMHGFALNIDPDLAAFARIVPCGLSEPVGAVSQFVPAVCPTDLQARVAAHFAAVFGCPLLPTPLAALGLELNESTLSPSRCANTGPPG